MTSTCDNIIEGSEHGEKSQVAIMPVECTAADKGHLDCTNVCCSNEMEANHPKHAEGYDLEIVGICAILV